MVKLSKLELDILKQTERAVRWRRFTRLLELALGVGILTFTFWAANDHEKPDWLIDGSGIFGLLAALGASSIVAGINNWGYRRDKLLVKLAEKYDASVA